MTHDLFMPGRSGLPSQSTATLWKLWIECRDSPCVKGATPIPNIIFQKQENGMVLKLQLRVLPRFRPR